MGIVTISAIDQRIDLKGSNVNAIILSTGTVSGVNCDSKVSIVGLLLDVN